MRRLIFALVIVTAIMAQTEWPAPTDLSVIEVAPGRLQLNWNPAPPLPVTPDTIAYDDATPRGIDGGGFRSTVSMRFSPEDPCSVIGLLFKAYPGFDGQISVRLFSDLMGNPVGMTGTGLVTPVDTNIITATAWNRVDFHEPYFTTEDFHIGIYNSDSNDIQLLYDGAVSATPTRSRLLNGAYLDDIPGDMLMRALVRYPGDDHLYRVDLGKRVTVYDDPFNTMTDIMPTTSTMSPEETMTPTYQVFRYTSPLYAGSVRATTDDLTWTDEALDYDVTYYYRVRADYGSGHTSAYCGPVPGITRHGGDDCTVYDTLKIDGGIAVGHVSWAMGNNMAVKLTPESPALLYSLLFHFNEVGTFRPAIYEVRRGEPATELFLWPSALTARTGWDPRHIFSEGLIVDREFIASCNFRDGALSLSWGSPLEPNCTYDYHSSGSWSAVADTAYFIRAVVKYECDKWYVNLRHSWNLVSMPVVPTDATPAALFPTRVGDVYMYDGVSDSYEVPDSGDLVPGQAYWVLSSSDTSYIIEGTPVETFDIPVSQGWNLIGSIAGYEGFSADEIETFPEGILGSLGRNLWWFDPVERSYDIDDGNRLCPGKGYWILLDADGYLRVSR